MFFKTSLTFVTDRGVCLGLNWNSVPTHPPTFHFYLFYKKDLGAKIFTFILVTIQGHPCTKYAKFFWKNKISLPLTPAHTSAYQGLTHSSPMRPFSTPWGGGRGVEKWCIYALTKWMISNLDLNHHVTEFKCFLDNFSKNISQSLVEGGLEGEQGGLIVY